MSTRTRLTLVAVVVFVGAALAAFVGLFVAIERFPTTAADRGELPRRSDVIAIVTGGALAAGTAFAAIGSVFAWVLSGALLRPLDRISAAALRAADGDLSQRIGLRRTDEFGRLAATFDTMLDRLEDAVAAHERFAANAAHELRTPLAVIGTVTEVAIATPARRDVDEVLRRIAHTNARAIETCEALLALADVNTVSMRREPVDLNLLVSDVVAEAGVRSVIDVGTSTESESGRVVVPGDSRLLRQAIQNLLENADRHAPGSAVSVRVTPAGNGGGARFVIENDGAPLDPGQVAQFAEPFLRGVGRGKAPGHGLGLALVDRVAVVHGGSLRLTARAEGGLRAQVDLPG